jgi:frataxin-like iron-binding protein CyaY
MSEPRLPTEDELREFRRLVDERLAEVEASLKLASADAKPVGLDLAIGRVSRIDALQQQQIAVARLPAARESLAARRASGTRAVSGALP